MNSASDGLLPFDNKIDNGDSKHSGHFPDSPIGHSEDNGYHPQPPRGGLVVVWWSALMVAIVHLSFLYSVYMTVFYIKLATTVWACIYGYATILSITIGAHRLYSHRSFKAHPLLRLALVLFFTASAQLRMYTWVRYHRLHHKYTETDADPHNSQRGFFFAHIGWVVCRRQPEMKEKERKVDMSDLKADPFVMFQKRW